eukprot:2703189-Karenia_brevis.AAC.1
MRKAAAAVRVVRARTQERKERERMKLRWTSQTLQNKLISPNGQSFKKESRKEQQTKDQMKDQRSNQRRNNPRGRREQPNPHQMKK